MIRGLQMRCFPALGLFLIAAHAQAQTSEANTGLDLKLSPILLAAVPSLTVEFPQAVPFVNYEGLTRILRQAPDCDSAKSNAAMPWPCLRRRGLSVGGQA